MHVRPSESPPVVVVLVVPSLVVPPLVVLPLVVVPPVSLSTVVAVSVGSLVPLVPSVVRVAVVPEVLALVVEFPEVLADPSVSELPPVDEVELSLDVGPLPSAEASVCAVSLSPEDALSSPWQPVSATRTTSVDMERKVRSSMRNRALRGREGFIGPSFEIWRNSHRRDEDAQVGVPETLWRRLDPRDLTRGADVCDGVRRSLRKPRSGFEVRCLGSAAALSILDPVAAPPDLIPLFFFSSRGPAGTRSISAYAQIRTSNRLKRAADTQRA